VAMTFTHCFLLFLAATAEFALATWCAAQTVDKSFRASDSAASYEIRQHATSDSKLQLRLAPILRWTNPVPEKQMHGELFLWSDDGRPAAVLNVFQMNAGTGATEYHEFCSLSEGGLVANGPGSRRWSPAMPQLKMSPLPDAPRPASSAPLRLRQMRDLASRFTCHKTNRKDETSALRMLARPIARYDSNKHEVADGGLFVFVEATDPEVFLLVEARSRGGSLAWHFGLARMASVRLSASLTGRTVWEVETLPYEDYRNRPDSPYALFPAP
jgi:hypothetical protein